MKFSKNFLCISCFNDDLDWFKSLDYPHIIYDKCFAGIKKTKYYPFDIGPSNLSQKYPDLNITQGEVEGYNINEYLSYIINNYDRLPDNIVFIKGNIIKRHVSLEFLKNVLDNNYFTSIEDWSRFQSKNINRFNKSFFISSDGGWAEINNSWYLNKRKHPCKYFNNFNTFMGFIFKSYICPKYIRFCPGANYIVPKNNIKKYDLIFYKNLKYLIKYSQLSGESHILERGLLNIWNSNYQVSENMKVPFNELTSFPKKDNIIKANIKKLVNKLIF